MKKKIFDNKVDRILYRVLSESKISYTPEMIDKFVMESKNDLSAVKMMFNTHLGRIRDLSPQNVCDDLPQYIQLHQKMENNEKLITSKHTKYYNIVDLYDIYDMPNNVNELEKITDEFDTMYYDYGKLTESLDELIEIGKRLQNFLK